MLIVLLFCLFFWAGNWWVSEGVVAVLELSQWLGSLAQIVALGLGVLLVLWCFGE